MSIFSFLQRLFTPKPEKQRAQHLYIALVEQARNPLFYEGYGVPDTLDGRFEMITLHMFLMLERMRKGFGENPQWEKLSQLLIESYLSDMDRSLREMGASDTGIGKRIKRMASGFYGRMDAYKAADEDVVAWAGALQRNVYGTAPDATDTQLTYMYSYVCACRAMLADADFSSDESIKRIKFGALQDQADLR